MATPRRETSAESAARFHALRGGPRRSSPVFRAAVDRAKERRLAPRRIVVDFAEPTLRLIRDVLLEAIAANVKFGDRGALLMIAEQMVAQALGEPACDDPPLTDREVR